MIDKIVIVDYQLGNLFSVVQACNHLGYDVLVSSSPLDIQDADYLILPGVGAFADAMNNLIETGMDKAIHQYVIEGKPLMGVCLGLQLLFTESEEFGNTKGLNLINGVVRKFEKFSEAGKAINVPQIQWNQIYEPGPAKWKNSPLHYCQPLDYMYFVHSYFVKPEQEADVLSLTDYGGQEYCSSVLKGNVFATQFHPEKSGLYGINIYKEWFTLNKKQN